MNYISPQFHTASETRKRLIFKREIKKEQQDKLNSQQSKMKQLEIFRTT